MAHDEEQGVLPVNTLVRTKIHIVLYGGTKDERRVDELVPRGTYGLVRYYSEDGYGVMWLRPEGATCIEVAPRHLEVVEPFPSTNMPQCPMSMEQAVRVALEGHDDPRLTVKRAAYAIACGSRESSTLDVAAMVLGAVFRAMPRKAAAIASPTEDETHE